MYIENTQLEFIICKDSNKQIQVLSYLLELKIRSDRGRIGTNEYTNIFVFIYIFDDNII